MMEHQNDGPIDIIDEEGQKGLDFDIGSRLQLIRFLSELNEDDPTTHDSFFVSLLRNFEGSSMSDLVTRLIVDKGTKLRQIPLAGIRPCSFQTELFHRFSLHFANQLVYLPSGSGKSLIGHMAMKYMLQQNADKKVVFIGPNASSITLHAMQFVEWTLTPSNLVGIYHSSKSKQIHPIQQVRAIFITIEMFLEMLQAKEIFFHHCSLLVVDEFQMAIRSPGLIEFYRSYWNTELRQFLPRLLGLVGAPNERLSISTWFEFMGTAAQLWHAEFAIPVFPESLAHLNAISWLDSPKFEISEYSSSSDALAQSLSQYISQCVRFLIELHRHHKSQQATNFKVHALRPSNPSIAAAIQLDTTSWHDVLMDQLILLFELFEHGEQDFSIYSRIATRFSRLIPDLRNSTTSECAKVILDDISKAWEAAEEIDIFGFAFARPSLLSLVNLLQDESPDAQQAVPRKIFYHINQSKDILRTTLSSTSGGTGKSLLLVSALVQLGPGAQAIVCVQQASIASKVASFLKDRLAESFNVLSISDNFDDAVADYQSGKCRVLVTPLMRETSEIPQKLNADLVVRLDGIQSCRSLIQYPMMSKSSSHEASFMIIARPTEIDEWKILASKEALTMALLRAHLDPEGAERDNLNIAHLDTVYQTLESQRRPSMFQINHLNALSATSVPPRRNTGMEGVEERMGAAGQGLYHAMGAPQNIPVAASSNPYAILQSNSGSATGENFSRLRQVMQGMGASGMTQEHPQMMQSIQPMAGSHGGSHAWGFMNGMTNTAFSASAVATSVPPMSGGGMMQTGGNTANSVSGLYGGNGNQASTKTVSNPIGYLQEHFQKKAMAAPTYTEVSGIHGGNSFVVECSVSGRHERGHASTKKQAKTEAATAMIRALGI